MVWILKAVKRIDRAKLFLGWKPRWKRSDHNLVQVIEKKFEIWIQVQNLTYSLYLISEENLFCQICFLFYIDENILSESTIMDKTFESNSDFHVKQGTNPVDTRRKLNVHKTFRRGRLLNVLCPFNLRPVSTGEVALQRCS